MKNLTDSALQAEIDQLDRMLSAKKAVKFHRDEVAKHERLLGSWRAGLADAEARLAELVAERRRAAA